MARPAGNGHWPGVIVIHDIIGMTNDVRRQADWLASENYLAFAPDLGYSVKHPTCVRDAIRQTQARRGSVFDRVEAAREGLMSRDDCSGRIGVIGFCIGGGFALLIAASATIEVACVNYGDVPDDAEALLTQSCPMVASFGARDKRLHDAPSRLRAALAANGIEHDVVEYANAGHAFMNQHGNLVTAIGRIRGMTYDGVATADARSRIVRFFDAHLL